jgi:RING-box protein 1
MADVEMTDAGAAPKVKSAKAGASGDAVDGKKKFEVKKVGWLRYEAHSCMDFS